MFKHGTHVVRSIVGSQPNSFSNDSLIALVGIAPVGEKQVIHYVRSAKQAMDLFGVDVPGFSIPRALEVMFAEKASGVFVVNVFDSATMTTAVVNETQAVSGGKAKTTHAPVGAIVVKNAAGDVTYVNGTDYIADALGNITIKQVITEGASLRVSYSRLNAAAVTASVIVGTDTGGVATGMELWKRIESTYSLRPSILVAPTYCELATVGTKLVEMADYFGATTYIDAPSGNQSVSTVLAARGLSGTWSGFRSQSKNLELLYMYLKDAKGLFPASAAMAGLRSRITATPGKGRHVSTSNNLLFSATGVEYNLAGDINDSSSDYNALNAAGITTFRTATEGIYAWGNRNASFPVNTNPDSFTAAHFEWNGIDRFLKELGLKHNDLGLTTAFIELVIAEGKAYLRARQAANAVLSPDMFYDPSLNPSTELAAGRITFSVVFATTVPGEFITFNSTLDLTLYNSLNQ